MHTQQTHARICTHDTHTIHAQTHTHNMHTQHVHTTHIQCTHTHNTCNTFTHTIHTSTCSGTSNMWVLWAMLLSTNQFKVANAYLLHQRVGCWQLSTLVLEISVRTQSLHRFSIYAIKISSQNHDISPEYVVGVWGFKTFHKLQTIQNKAIRHVMDVGINCPVDLLVGDSG